MACDADRALAPDLPQDVLRRLVGADEPVDAQRYDVGVLARPRVVLRNLGAGNHQQLVLPPRPLRLLTNRVEIGRESLFGDGEGAPAERRQPSGAPQPVLLAEDVVGDGNHVEVAGPAVQIDQLAQGQRPVAPGRVHVEVTVVWRLAVRVEKGEQLAAGVPSVLALLTTTISSGGHVWRASEARHACRNRSSLWAQTITLIVSDTPPPFQPCHRP